MMNYIIRPKSSKMSSAQIAGRHEVGGKNQNRLDLCKSVICEPTAYMHIKQTATFDLLSPVSCFKCCCA